MHVASPRLLGAFLIVAVTLAGAWQPRAASADTAGHSHGAPAQAAGVDFGAPASAAKADRTIDIVMTTLTFEPSSIAVRPGETVRFVIRNTSRVDHEFTLGDAATQRAHRKEMAEMSAHGQMMHHGDPNMVAVKAGQTGELTWTFHQPGLVEFDCNLPGHFEGGMRGTVTVAPATAAQTR